MKLPYLKFMVIVLAGFLLMGQVLAHHVLGRPSYSLNEDSTTPPSSYVEVQIGDYLVNYMAFPAFPKPNEQGRLNFYASRIDSGKSFDGKVTFKARNDSWFSSHIDTLGVQSPDDHIYHQSFVFSENGNYIISVEFTDKGTPYTVDFPLRIGAPPAIGPTGITVVLVFVGLLIASTIQRNKLKRFRTKRHHTEESGVENV